MKMVKSLILGTAVAFAATAGAQAADLPVKAKPVSYVKICPQYGPGFYYIPGTDICLRVGGQVRAEFGYYGGNSGTVQLSNGANGFDGADNRLGWRSRGYIILDARQNTAYGTLRAYINGGLQQTSAPVAPAAGVNNSGFLQWAFIQFAGFTAGTATSFFDFDPNWLVLNVSANPYNWTNLFAYTANFGNGLSATISIEDPTWTRLNISATPAALLPQAAQEAPDVVGNFRVDQGWGSAQLMVAAHHVRPDISGLAIDDWGWAAGIGVQIKLPMIGSASAIKFVAVTFEGAPEYTGLSGSGNGSGAGVIAGYGPVGAGAVLVTDGSFAGGVLTLTEGSSFMLQLRHSWTPQLSSVFHAGYNDAYNLSAAGFGGVQIVQYGHSLTYAPVKNLNLSFDVVFTEIDANNVETDKVATWFRVTRPF